MARGVGPRLTGGRARGRPLVRPVPKGARPTSSRVREALFSLLGNDLSGQRVLDGFGGSGLLALEAWSRGASVVCVERNGGAVRAIRANVDALGAEVQVVCSDLLHHRGGPYDIALLDPPYALDPTPFLEHVAALQVSTIVLEGPKGSPSPQVDGLALDRQRCYGDTVLRVYQREVG